MSSITMMTASMTVLDVLMGGGSVKLPNGIILKGDPETFYIDIGYEDMDGDFVSEGLWSLSESGLNDALRDAQKIAEELADES